MIHVDSSIEEIRLMTDHFLEMWAIAHQEHPIFEGGPKQGLWLMSLVRCRANLEIELAFYRVALKGKLGKCGRWF